MSEVDKINPKKNFPFNGQPIPCFDFYTGIDPGTNTPEAVLLIDYLQNDEVLVQRIFLALGIPAEEQMSLEEYNRGKRIAHGEVMEKIVQIPGWMVPKYEETLRTISGSGDGTAYVLSAKNDAGETMVLYHSHDPGFPPRIDTVTQEKLLRLRQESEKINASVIKNGWDNFENSKKENKSDEMLDVI